MLQKINEQGAIKRMDEGSLQGMLVNESEIISTGVLKLDIYEESDRSALEAQSASEAQSQMLQQTINK